MNVERLDRKYQDDDARRILRALQEFRRVLYVLPTGGGKTVIAAWLMLQWVRAGKRVLVMVHRGELLEQMYSTLTKMMGIDESIVGVIWRDDYRTNSDAPIQVASIDTANRRRLYPRADVLVLDEAHRAVAATWIRMLGWYPEASVLGLTATPIRLDGKPLNESFDVMVEGPTIQSLIDAGYLIKPRVFVRQSGRSIDMTNVRRHGGDYDRCEMEKRATVHTVIAGCWDHIQEHAQGRNGLIYACGIVHGERLAEEGRARGRLVAIITGDSGIRERRRMLDPGGWLDSGTRRYVVSCDVLNEGYDLPSLKLVVSARPTLSEALYLHQCGRILRLHKERWWSPMILDLTTNTIRFGVPQEVRLWSLSGSKKKTGPSVPPRAKVCPECEAVVSLAEVLCECGYKFPARQPKEISGQLLELNAAEQVEINSYYDDLLGRARAHRRVRDPESFARAATAMRYGRLPQAIQ